MQQSESSFEMWKTPSDIVMTELEVKNGLTGRLTHKLTYSTKRETKNFADIEMLQGTSSDTFSYYEVIQKQTPRLITSSSLTITEEPISNGRLLCEMNDSTFFILNPVDINKIDIA